MNETIRNVEGIGEEYQKKLEYIGVKTVSELLAVTQTEDARKELARRSGVPLGHINNWASMLDLTRIEGIGYQYAELLTHAGVKSVEDFRKRNPENLFEIIKETNEKKHFTGNTPSMELLTSLIHSSKEITNIVQRY